MAKIEMDISEYEALKENKKLLQDALNREKEQSNKIEKLKQEKIETLEKSKYQVHYITKTEHTEHMLVKKDYISVLRRLGVDIAKLNNGNFTKDYYISEYNKAIDYLFEKTTSMSYPETDIVETKGLEEVKEELRKEEINKLNKKLKLLLSKEKELNDFEITKRKIENSLEKAEKYIAQLQENNKKISDDLEKSIEDNKKLNERITNILTKLKQYIDNRFYLSNNKLREIVNSF